MANTNTTARELAAIANGKGKPAARITGPNIEAVQAKLKGHAPSAALGIDLKTLGQLATGKRKKSSLPDEQRAAFDALGKALGRETYYLKKLASMCWAVEKSASQKGGRG